VNTFSCDLTSGFIFAKRPLFCHKEEVPFAKQIVVAMSNFYMHIGEEKSEKVKAEEE
jgi:hypothetical protein